MEQKRQVAGPIWLSIGAMAGLFALGTLNGWRIGHRQSPGERQQSAAKSPENPVEVTHLGGFNAVVLLSDRHVASELALTDLQRERIRQSANEFLESTTQRLTAAREIVAQPKGEQERRWQQLYQENQRALTSANRLALSTLEAPQRRRLAQIALRLRGEGVFYEVDVISMVKLDQLQRKSIATWRNDFLAAAHDLRERAKRGELTKDDHARRLLALRRRLHHDYESLLTPAQREIYDELCGPPIPFSPEDISWELRPVAYPRQSESPELAPGYPPVQPIR
jgi:hypothetical protein